MTGKKIIIILMLWLNNIFWMNERLNEQWTKCIFSSHTIIIIATSPNACSMAYTYGKFCAKKTSVLKRVIWWRIISVVSVWLRWVSEDDTICEIMIWLLGLCCLFCNCRSGNRLLEVRCGRHFSHVFVLFSFKTKTNNAQNKKYQ